jgi:hypothetical protein
MLIRERLRESWSDIRQFFRLKSRGRWVERLKDDQADLVSRLATAYEKLGSDPGGMRSPAGSASLQSSSEPRKVV